MSLRRLLKNRAEARRKHGKKRLNAGRTPVDYRKHEFLETLKIRLKHEGSTGKRQRTKDEQREFDEPIKRELNTGRTPVESNFYLNGKKRAPTKTRAPHNTKEYTR